MALGNFFKTRTEELGLSDVMVCPNCGKETRLSLYSSTDLNDVMMKLLNKKGELNFAVCPLCAAVFEINMSSYGIENDVLHDYNLKPIERK